MAKFRMPERSKVLVTARRALTADGFVSGRGWCAMWVRQVMQTAGVPLSIFPNGYGSAKAQYRYFKSKGYEKKWEYGLKHGDLLYKVGLLTVPNGHVGIYIGGGLVAENSSAHVGPRDREARGIRKLSSYKGAKVIRLPLEE